MKKEVTDFKESYRIPRHRQSQCHLEETEKVISLISYATKVAYFDKCHASNYSSHLLQLYCKINPTSPSYHLS